MSSNKSLPLPLHFILWLLVLSFGPHPSQSPPRPSTPTPPQKKTNKKHPPPWPAPPTIWSNKQQQSVIDVSVPSPTLHYRVPPSAAIRCGHALSFQRRPRKMRRSAALCVPEIILSPFGKMSTFTGVGGRNLDFHATNLALLSQFHHSHIPRSCQSMLINNNKWHELGLKANLHKALHIVFLHSLINTLTHSLI